MRCSRCKRKIDRRFNISEHLYMMTTGKNIIRDKKRRYADVTHTCSDC